MKRDSYFQFLHLEEGVEGLLRGILFGEKNQIADDVYDDFRKNGTAHVLAVSGLHVGILYSAYKKLYERKKSIFFTIAFILFLLIYGSAALWAVSVTRAIGLVLLVTLGKSFHRRYDLLTAVSAMAMVSMIQNPYVIFGAAFQMSFLAVVSITFLQRFFEGLVGEKWAVPFAVQAGLMPYMAYTFNYVSFVGILCNVPVIFLATLLVPLGMIGFVFFLFTGILLPDLSMALEWISRLMIWTNHVFLADGVLSFDVISPPMWMMLLLYGIMFFCTSEYFHIYFYRKEWRKLLVPILLILVIVLGGLLTARSAFDRAELVFVDVGQGDCLHVKTPKGIQVLIDGGGRFGYDMGEKTLKPYLLKNRVDYLDLVATTHLHLDHYGGIEQLLSCYPVNQLITAGKKGDCIVLEDGYFVEILWPMTQNPKTEDENENSLIFMIHHNGLKTLITGDITAEGEDMLLKAYRGTDKLKADILKVAHHGSSYSSSDAFLDAVNPQVAVISVGQNNYGHPSEIVIENLEKKGIMVFRTDMDGAVGIINRKGTISVCTKKQR